ncbi:TIGR00730 family Rossman fold protein [Actinomadura sp. B10D3]|uniref:LOG family protein n=1 Tax=Actinomadura sp. B10D3 TaxID=3153557 RepID=UPI00325E027E
MNETISLGNSREFQLAQLDADFCDRFTKELVEGLSLLAGVKRAVTVFGSARTAPGIELYERGVDVGGALARAGFTVITGGGPGAMEAANKGARDEGGQSLGLGIELPREQGLNRFINRGVEFRHFCLRKLVMEEADAFVVMPGGFGTFDELFEVLTLIQTAKLRRSPVILVDTKYWKGLISWLEDKPLSYGTISEEDLDLVHVVDTAREVLEVLRGAAS